MTSDLVIYQDNKKVKRPISVPSLLGKHENGVLEITLPEAEPAARQCMRAQLPGYISRKLLDIFDFSGEKQIYRILNELETSTDDIVHQEGISRVSWLPQTNRPALTPYAIATQGIPVPVVEEADRLVHTTQLNGHQAVAVEEAVTSTTATSLIPQLQHYEPLPASIPHELQAPHYWKVIEHVHRQASKIGNSLRPGFGASVSVDDLASNLANLGLGDAGIDPNERPDLFGRGWLSNFRLGAAGELFVSPHRPLQDRVVVTYRVVQVYEVLSHMLGNEFSLENWQSSIRYLVAAHDSYKHVIPRTGQELADIVFRDPNKSIEPHFSRLWGVRSDAFEDWYRAWFQDSSSSSQFSVSSWYIDCWCLVLMCVDDP
jgi:hypothetical protein